MSGRIWVSLLAGILLWNPPAVQAQAPTPRPRRVQVLVQIVAASLTELQQAVPRRNLIYKMGLFPETRPWSEGNDSDQQIGPLVTKEEETKLVSDFQGGLFQTAFVQTLTLKEGQTGKVRDTEPFPYAKKRTVTLRDGRRAIFVAYLNTEALGTRVDVVPQFSSDGQLSLQFGFAEHEVGSSGMLRLTHAVQDGETVFLGGQCAGPYAFAGKNFGKDAVVLVFATPTLLPRDDRPAR